jgi:hypothetical protein
MSLHCAFIYYDTLVFMIKQEAELTFDLDDLVKKGKVKKLEELKLKKGSFSKKRRKNLAKIKGE